MHEILFTRDQHSDQSLAAFAARVFARLSLDTYEERESSNYIDGHYFVGYATNAALTVCHADSVDIPDYPFWIVLESPRSTKATGPLESTSPESIAVLLGTGGFDVFIPTKGWDTVGWIHGGTRYGA